MINKKYKNIKGFSLLEVIISISIITVGLVGILSLVVQNIQVSYTNKSTMIASQLAQEGIDLVKNMRDENWIKGVSWDDDFANEGTMTFVIDYRGRSSLDETVNDISEAGAKLNLRDDVGEEGFYWHEATDPASPFSRLITTVQAGADAPVEVTSRVSWSERGSTHYYETSAFLYNWQ